MTYEGISREKVIGRAISELVKWQVVRVELRLVGFPLESFTAFWLDAEGQRKGANVNIVEINLNLKEISCRGYV